MKLLVIVIAYFIYGVILVIIDFLKPRDEMNSPIYVLQPSFAHILFAVFYKPIRKFVNMFTKLLSKRYSEYTFFIFLLDFIIQMVYTIVFIGGITILILRLFS